MRFGIIIQARMSSTRLPNKVLKSMPENGDKTVLEHVVRRCLRVEQAADIIVATTTNEADDAIVEMTTKLGIRFFRGSESDVLERYYLAAKSTGLDAIMRITSDCPCHDPQILNDMITRFKESGVDYLSNTIVRTFPHGLDAELFSFSALEKAYNEAKEPPQREHVTPYIYNSGLFKTENYAQENDSSKLRVTLDTTEDYALLCTVFSLLGNEFGLQELEQLFIDKPWLDLINGKVEQKKVFTSLDEELNEAIQLLHKQDMPRAAEILSKAQK
jgi:spore coat polysaccharide biosynthesis protein SpsF